MKKLLSTLAYVALLSPLSAVNAQQAFTGWDVGFTAGVIDAQSKFNHVNNTGADIDIFDNINFNGRLGQTSGLVGISLGYAGCFNPCWNWGIEGRANWTGLKTSFDANFVDTDEDPAVVTSAVFNAHLQTKLNAQYAIIGQLGYLLSPSSQLYVFVGPQWGHFKSNGSANVTLVDAAGAVSSIGVSGSSSKYKTGVLAGVGLEQMIGDCYSIGLEYNYGHYGSHSHNRHDTFLVDGVVATGDTSFFNHNHDAKLNTNAMLAKFNWFFG